MGRAGDEPPAGFAGSQPLHEDEVVEEFELRSALHPGEAPEAAVAAERFGGITIDHDISIAVHRASRWPLPLQPVMASEVVVR